MGCNGESQTLPHAGGIVFDFEVEKMADFGEFNDCRQQAARLRGRQAEQGGINVNVVAGREILLEANAQLQKRRHAAA